MGFFDFIGGLAPNLGAFAAGAGQGLQQSQQAYAQGEQIRMANERQQADLARLQQLMALGEIQKQAAQRSMLPVSPAVTSPVEETLGFGPGAFEQAIGGQPPNLGELGTLAGLYGRRQRMDPEMMAAKLATEKARAKYYGSGRGPDFDPYKHSDMLTRQIAEFSQLKQRITDMLADTRASRLTPELQAEARKQIEAADYNIMSLQRQRGALHKQYGLPEFPEDTGGFSLFGGDIEGLRKMMEEQAAERKAAGGK